MKDIQSTADTRRVRIHKVGIKELAYPVTLVQGEAFLQSTVARINLYVSLAEEHKGTHMSRFIEIIHKHHGHLDVYSLGDILSETRERLGSEAAYIEVSFPYFIVKKAPISRIEGLMDYECEIQASDEGTGLRSRMKVCVPIKTLCPCSKAISIEGAHNQRSHVSVALESKEPVLIEELVELIESCASSDLYSILKRDDEKYVTEKAYQNPFFVEDVVREVTLKLKQKPNILAFQVESENFESIHNHNAYAYIHHTL